MVPRSAAVCATFVRVPDQRDAVVDARHLQDLTARLPPEDDADECLAEAPGAGSKGSGVASPTRRRRAAAGAAGAGAAQRIVNVLSELTFVARTER